MELANYLDMVREAQTRRFNAAIHCNCWNSSCRVLYVISPFNSAASTCNFNAFIILIIYISPRHCINYLL